MSLLTDFRRRGLLYQTIIAGVIFLLVYTLYMDYIGKANIGDSLFAAIIFAGSYFFTSTIILRRGSRNNK